MIQGRTDYFYIPSDVITEDHAIMTDRDECRHLVRVLRKRTGDSVTFVDGRGWVYTGIIDQIETDSIRIGSITGHQDESESSVRVTLAPALIKGARLDMVVEKATELGIDRIMPMQTSRTIVEPGTSKTRQMRWQRIALSAMKQSLRSRLPVIQPISTFQDVAQYAGTCDLALIAWESEQHEKLEALPVSKSRPQSVIVMIGPEGGFDADEITVARRIGIQSISLGQRRLRSDTASLVAIAKLMTVLGEL